MMIVLGISTSSPRGTVAVADGETILARIAYEGGTSHAERLFFAIDEALAVAGIEKHKLQALACDVGPGSFTGVRVGVATCQGIAVGLGVPVLGIGSLEAMAIAARGEGARGGSILAVLDARKEEVYAAVFDGAGRELWGPFHRPCAEAEDLAAVARRFGAAVAGEIAATLGLEGVVRGESIDLPDATTMALLAMRRLAGVAPGIGDASLLEPRYVRPPDAKPMAEQGRTGPSPEPSAPSSVELGAGEPQGE